MEQRAHATGNSQETQPEPRPLAEKRNLGRHTVSSLETGLSSDTLPSLALQHSAVTSSLVEQAREGSPDCPHPGNSPVNGTLWLLPKPTFSGSWASTSFLSLRSRKGRSTLCRRRIMRMVSSSFRSTWVPDSKSQPCLQKRGARHGDGQLCHQQQLELVVLWARRSTLPREGENSAISFMECLRSRYHGWSPLCFPPTPRTHLTAGSWASLSCYQFGVYNHNVS